MPQEKCPFKGEIKLPKSSTNGRYFQCPECGAYRVLDFGAPRHFPFHRKNTIKRDWPAFHWKKDQQKWEYQGVGVEVGIAHEVQS